MIDAVILDFDGIVLDTERAVFRAVAELFTTYGASLSEEEFAAEIGSHWDEWALLSERATLPIPDQDTVQGEIWSRIGELTAVEAALPGVTAWLDEAAGLGLALGVASSSTTGWVCGHLERLGLIERFQTFACCDQGGHAGKPAPDTYVAACRDLGADPSQALAVEDSANGVTAAKEAGLWCVAVPTDLTSRLDLTHADLRIDSLTAASLSEVIASIEGRGC